MALTKAKITEGLYHQGGLTRRRANRLIESLLELIKDRLVAGEDLLVSGFGRLKIRDKAARPGRNPYTGDKITLRSRRVVSFKPSRVLKRQMNPK